MTGYLTLDEAATLLRTSRYKLVRLERGGYIPRRRMVPGLSKVRRFKLADLADFLFARGFTMPNPFPLGRPPSLATLRARMKDAPNVTIRPREK